MQVQASLGGFLAFYNFERPHQGYRTQGRTPAEVFWDAIRHEVRQEVRSASTFPVLDTLEEPFLHRVQ